MRIHTHQRILGPSPLLIRPLFHHRLKPIITLLTLLTLYDNLIHTV
jgi:hypothetical protein